MRVNLQTSRSTQFSILSEHQTESIFHGMLEVLQRTGVDIHQEETTSILKKADAMVDGTRVFIPSVLIRYYLTTQRHRIPAWDQQPREEYHWPNPAQ